MVGLGMIRATGAITLRAATRVVMVVAAAIIPLDVRVVVKVAAVVMVVAAAIIPLDVRVAAKVAPGGNTRPGATTAARGNRKASQRLAKAR